MYEGRGNEHIELGNNMKKYIIAYGENKDFKEYVDKYVCQHRISVEEALKHYLVHEYYDYLLQQK